MIETSGIILLYCVASIVAIISQRARVPYTAALLVVGVALGALHIVELPHLTKDLLFAIFLPGLLFEASYHLALSELKENAIAIGALAVPGVVAAIALTAVFLMGGAWALGESGTVGWTTALVFGGVIAATDPVAVTALFRALSAPRRLHVLVESESLLNDGTSIVFLTLMLAYFSGEAPTVVSLVISFVKIALGGAAIGAFLGWLISLVRTRLDDAAIEITLTTIAAYGSFALAEHFHLSGVIATVAAGVVCGHTNRYHPNLANTAKPVAEFWEWLAFALNSAVFLLLGAELPTNRFLSDWKLLVFGALAVVLARGVVVTLVSVGLIKTTERISRAWSLVIVWGGLRGALSLVLALALPDNVGDRSLIVALTAATVLLSLLGQGMTMPILLRKLGVGGNIEQLDKPLLRLAE